MNAVDTMTGNGKMIETLCGAIKLEILGATRLQPLNSAAPVLSGFFVLWMVFSIVFFTLRPPRYSCG